MDASGRIRGSNQRLWELFDAKPAATGVDAWTALPNFPADARPRPDASPETPTTGTCRLNTGRTLAWVRGLLTGAEPGQSLFVYRFADETRLAEAEAALEAANRRLVELNRAKAQFLNSAAHELATPITPMALQVALLQAGSLGPLTERQAEALILLERNMDRLRRHLKDIVDASDLEEGRFRIKSDPVNLASVIESVQAALEPGAKTRSIQLESQADPRLWVRGDEERLAQALRHLVDNAIKFSSPRKRVRIRGQRDGLAVVVEVEDEGRGLQPEEFQRLFQPFSHTAGSTSGRGLGLVLAQGIVEAHGGRIWCHSPGPGRGATFSLSLPFQESDASPEDNGGKQPWHLVHFRCPVCASRDIEMRFLRNRYECAACRHVWR